MEGHENTLARKFTAFSLFRFAMPTIIMMVFMGLYQVVDAILSFVRTFVLLTVFLLVFPNIWGITGAWLAPPLAEFMSSILAIALVVKYRHTYFSSGLPIEK